MANLPNDTETISISLPCWMLEIVCMSCQEHDISKSQFIKDAIKSYLPQKLPIKNSEFWEALYKTVKEES